VAGIGFPVEAPSSRCSAANDPLSLGGWTLMEVG